MKLIWTLLVVGSLTLLNYSATNSAVIITEVEMSISSPTAVDPGIILHISDHLTPAECCQLVIFLGNNTENPEYSLPIMKKLAGPNLSSCRCHDALKWWNEDLLKDSFDEIDKEKLGEDLLVFGMKYLGFTEMEKFLKNLERQKIHNEVTKLKHDLDEHKKEGEATEQKNSKKLAGIETDTYDSPPSPNPKKKKLQRFNFTEILHKISSLQSSSSSIKNVKQDKKNTNNNSLLLLNEESIDYNRIILIGLMVSASISVLVISLFIVRFVVSRKRKDEYHVMMLDKDDGSDQEEETEWML